MISSARQESVWLACGTNELMCPDWNLPSPFRVATGVAFPFPAISAPRSPWLPCNPVSSGLSGEFTVFCPREKSRGRVAIGLGVQPYSPAGLWFRIFSGKSSRPMTDRDRSLVVIPEGTHGGQIAGSFGNACRPCKPGSAAAFRIHQDRTPICHDQAISKPHRPAKAD